MTRTIVIAAAVVVVVAIGWFAMVDRTGLGTAVQEPDVQIAAPPVDQAEIITDENVSAGEAAGIATDEAFDRAQAGEEPVQDTVDTARAAAGEAGAVGGSAFTVEGYDRETVVEAIDGSDLPEGEKEVFVERLDAAEDSDDVLETVLADVRLALTP